MIAAQLAGVYEVAFIENAAFFRDPSKTTVFFTDIMQFAFGSQRTQFTGDGQQRRNMAAGPAP